MPSTTRGSILISTANDIGEALVEKLGGVGYSPNDWKNNINLCGIAPVDSAPALSVLADSAGTGDERGSILIATADAIGAILNKKYNVLRGFKPKEWASACRKMKALEEGSVASASIASFSDGADTVPLTSCVCSIDANLDGKTAVVGTKTGKNLFILPESGFSIADMNFIVENESLIISGQTAGGGISSKNQAYKDNFSFGLPAGTYYFTRGTWNRAVYLYDLSDDNTALVTNSGSFTLSKYTVIYIGFYIGANLTITDATFDGYLVQGSTSSTYSSQRSRKYTASLGRAVYGGSADIVNGTGTVGYALFTKNTADMNNSESYPGWKDQGVRAICGGGLNQEYEDGVTSAGNGYGINTLGNSNDILYLPKSMHNNMTQTDWIALAIDITFVIPLATPVDFTFEPVKIDSFPGVNNIWNDCGNTAVEYYQAPTPYARKTATGGIANFSDQRTDLPLTKAIANIAPSIAGKSAVNLYQGKKNLLKLSDGEYNIGNTGATVTISNGELTVSGTTVNSGGRTTRLSDYFIIKAGTYFVSPVIGTSPYVRSYLNKKSDNSVVGYSSGYSFTVTEETEVYFGVNLENGYTYDVTLTPQLEVGSTASTFEPYQDPTTYTAELGETVYGGSVDFVSGEKSIEYGMITFDGSSDESWLYSDAYGWFYIDNQFGNAYRNNSESDFMICNLGTQSSYAAVTSLPDMHFACTSGTNSRFAFKNSQYSTVEAFKEWLSNNPMIVVYKLATPTESEIPGRVISPIEGVNNYWNDAGGDTEIEYFEEESEG